jgi:hypothetical protein
MAAEKDTEISARLDAEAVAGCSNGVARISPAIINSLRQQRNVFYKLLTHSKVAGIKCAGISRPKLCASL